MTIFAPRLAARAAACGVESRGRRGVYSTYPSNHGARCCSTTVPTSYRIVSQSGLALSCCSSQTSGRKGSEKACVDDARLRIQKACLGACRSGGDTLRLRRGSREQSIAAAAAGRTSVSECRLCRHAVGSRSQLPVSCIYPALGTMRIGGDGWKRAAGGALEQQRRKNSRRAFAKDDSRSDAPLLSTENSNKTSVSSTPLTKLLTLPTILTLARVAAVPAILAVFYCKETWATAAGVTIFILAAVTDWLDGFLARKMGSSSAFGAFLDPVADKLMVAAALVLLCTRPLPVSGLATTPWLLPLPTIAIIGREITMSAVREWAAAQGADMLKAVAVNNLGKIKTASQMIAITLLLATGDGGLDSKIASYTGIGLLYVAAGLALWSLAMYMKGIWSFLSK